MSDSPPESKVLPDAIPVKRETLRKARVELQDLPAAIFPEAEESLESGLVGPSAAETALEEPITKALLKEGPQEREKELAPQRTPAFQQPAAKPGSSINRKALESTNRGKSPNSRKFVRGILHPSPFKVAFAAFCAIGVRVCLVGFVILGALIFMGKLEPIMFCWAALLPFFALLHLITANQARCRVCGQKEFVPSGARKHQQTHRFLFFGPIVSTALHVLLFKWFRCMFCGTAVRIRK